MNKYLKSPITVVALCTGILLTVSCSTSQEPKTMRLFMQSKRPNISLPHNEGISPGMLAEQSEFTTTSDTMPPAPVETPDSADDIWRTVHLNNVSIVAARTVIKQVTARRGSVRLEFDIHVPSVLIDSCWRVTLTPMLNTSDSVSSPLLPVVLAGSDFIKMQEADYKAYDLFLKGIVDPSAYDSIYLDRKNINRDIARRQNLFYDLYGKERDRQMAYEHWKRLALDRQNYWNMRMQTNRTTLRHRLERKRIEEGVRRYVTGRDTFGLSAVYGRKYRRTASFWPKYRMERKLTASRVPSKYRALYVSGRTMSDIRNHTLSAADSAEISSHRYFFDHIAENEMNDRNRDLIRNRIIPFPYIDSVMNRQTALPGEDYVYNYVYTLPVTEGMKKLHLRLESIIEATDRSTWRPAASDTLLFVVASLSDLIDRSLLQQFIVTPPAGDSTLVSGDSITAEPTYSPGGAEYAEGLRLLQEREYRKALPMLQAHPDYNTALCLTQLGYHDEAIGLLKQLPSSARTKYLHAVVCARKGDDQSAVIYMLDACRMNPDLVLRIPLDPELSDLIPKFYGLRKELDKISEEGV
ncbi:tetratricopeptide repeat protein [Bacteroides heparinolyticus]|uniref:tetratricopeptide repeat protein n=1 Tax=Prevotella heparinolytica TaxID=28113 RepID=UPI0035A18834